MQRCHLWKLIVRLGTRLDLVNASDLPEGVIDICAFVWTEYNQLKSEDEIEINAHCGFLNAR